MFLHQLRIEFKQTVPDLEGLLKLMKSSFPFYADLAATFFDSLGSNVEQGALQGLLKKEIRHKLFDEQVCRGVEAVKKSCLAEIIKLEQSPSFGSQKTSQIIDLGELKVLADTYYELLQTHWELYRYQQSVVNDRVLVSFLEEVRLIELGWDLFIAKYLAVSRLLSQGETESLDPEGQAAVKVYFHRLESGPLRLEQTQKLIALFELAYQFTKEVHSASAETGPLQVLAFESGTPAAFSLVLPEKLAGSFASLLGYLSLDVIKRETLVKYVMEVLQQQQKQELPKPLINSHLKKLAKALGELPVGCYFALDEEKNQDSVHILSELLAEMDRMKLTYKDLMLGSERRLGRNNLPPVRDPKKPGGGSKTDSMVRISVAKKEHHGFLTS